jgi:hypothetical protein
VFDISQAFSRLGKYYLYAFIIISSFLLGFLLVPFLSVNILLGLLGKSVKYGGEKTPYISLQDA